MEKHPNVPREHTVDLDPPPQASRLISLPGYLLPPANDRIPLPDLDGFDEDECDGIHPHSDLALSLDWRTTEANWAATLGLSRLSPKWAFAREAILLQAIMALHLGYRAVSFSRRRAFYVGRQRYHGPAFTYDTLIPLIDDLGRLGLLELSIPEPGFRGLQSTLLATPKLLAAVPTWLLSHIFQRPRELIRLRDADRHWIDYQDDKRTDRMRRSLIRINEALRGTSIDYPGLDVALPGQAFRVGKGIVYRGKVMYRIFNVDLNHGGRSFGGGWQCASKIVRQRITIDGEAVVEEDHRQLHPRILHSHVGAPLDPGLDAYDLPGWERKVVKVAFNVLLNASNYQSALGAIANKLGGDDPRKAAAHLIAQLKAKHHIIKEYFHSRVGLELQAVDGDMAERVSNALLAKGVVSLGIHDSFIVQERHKGLLMEAMDDAYTWAAAKHRLR